ncbi:P-loop containing nucleoside triphosphate hydrolase protein [Ilyonectria robusta]|uniref:P-loop containing nucleoside triphosphate hydrolase protein n=1 Tax=Ilyonectria robusta TaxID=1079257 RepID=UPI001E8D520D|nr:P-loop containing nucleoside triphosphate hydrolase protein [Ilyonectria robusta]KAH8694780.1 P-loop containing nucleoside triphosphate hydrolase protein [Ilyonectria robusta]
MPARKPITLRSGLDRDVYQILKKLEDANDGKPFKTITAIYDAIKRSNSSLSRQKKRPLEDSIDRVLQFRKQELDESDSEAELDQAAPVNPEDDRFLLNRQMTKLWHDDSAPLTSNPGEGRAAKKRRLHAEGEESAGGKEFSTSAAVLTPADSNSEVVTQTPSTSKPGSIHRKEPKKRIQHKVERPSNIPKLGGVDEIYNDLLGRVRTILKRPKLFEWQNFRRVPGMLISGPSGVGKNTLIRQLVSDLEVPIISLMGCLELDDPQHMEKSLNDAIDEAMQVAPCVIFIQDLDKYMPSPGVSHNTERSRRTLWRFRQQMKKIQEDQPNDKSILAIATTSKTEDVDPHALKLGLFEQTIEMKLPGIEARRDIFKVVLEGVHLAEDVDFDELARISHGFVGTDIVDVTTRAQEINLARMAQDDDWSQILDGGHQIFAPETTEITSEIIPLPFLQPPPHPLNLADFKTAFKNFTPSLRKEGFTPIPNITWNQVGALHDVREQLRMSIIKPIKQPRLYESAGVNRPAGCLLWGPPGCGKTLVAQAVANEAQASFILINGPELLNKYVGESERAVRELFNRARASSPCILFFDEMDAIVPKRDNTSTEAGTRVVNALLTELDGARGRAGVYVIGTTNRPDMIDQAILRPGRLDVKLFLDLPTPNERAEILNAVYRSNRRGAGPEELSLLEGVALDSRCDGFSGADLNGLRIKAAQGALARYFKTEGDGERHFEIVKADWEFALANTHRSVSNPETYRKLAQKLR